MIEFDAFEAWWKKQDLGDKANYASDRAYRLVAWNGWLARSALTPRTEALPITDSEIVRQIRNDVLEEAAEHFDAYTWSPYKSPAVTIREMKRKAPVSPPLPRQEKP